MKKLLVISRKGRMAEVFADVAQNWFDQVVLAEPDEGFRGFLREIPTHVIILNCALSDGDTPEIRAWKNIKLLANGCPLMRCGDEEEEWPDYIRMPFAMEDMIRKMGG